MVTNGNSYLLDTSVFIDYLRGKYVAHKIIFDTRSTHVSAGYSIITEAELWAGISGLRTEASHIKLIQPFDRYFINITIARRAGQLKSVINNALKGQVGMEPPGLNDCLIAATAEFHDLTVVTRNEKHFKHFAIHAIDLQFYTI